MNDKLNTVYSYHEQTKHHPGRYARSVGYMDWANQPFPFRRFEGAPTVALPLPAADPDLSWDGLFDSVGKEPATVTPAAIGALFYFSLALSAWKQITDPSGEVVSRWALRVNPSSGNLHPTESYLVNADGVFHYAPDEHLLEKRGTIAAEAWATFSAGLPAGSFLVGLASIHWREAWKYGERAFRYCQHDVGHAVAAVSLSATCHRWRVFLMDRYSQEEIEALLGVDHQEGPEKEHADGLLLVVPAAGEGFEAPGELPQVTDWHGEPNTLSRSHQDWPVITEVAAATAGGTGERHRAGLTPKVLLPGEPRDLAAHALIRGRRSAVTMDPATGLDREAFFTILRRTLPGAVGSLFDVLPWAPQVSLAIFVHRVRGLDPGLYVLARHPEHADSLQESFDPDFAWETPPGCPADLPLFVLGTGDLRERSRQVSCGQAIAADGAFSLGMLARFATALQEFGPAIYPRLFWETGMVGQMLYLEAEAAGVRGTGIGCFFDDAMHEVLGISDHSWQSLYHFTVGGAVEDSRLQTTPAYPG